MKKQLNPYRTYTYRFTHILIAPDPSRLLQCCHNMTDKNRGDFTTGHMPLNVTAATYADRANTGCRNAPVTEAGFAATSSGEPVATTRPPAPPPSGPRSMR